MYVCARRPYTFAFLRGAGQAALRASRIRVAISSMPTMFLTCQYVRANAVTTVDLKALCACDVCARAYLCVRERVCVITCMSACAHMCLCLRVRVSASACV